MTEHGTADDIERALAEIPQGSTLGLRPIQREAQPEQPWTWDPPMARPSFRDLEREQREHADRVGSALRSIPERYRWIDTATQQGRDLISARCRVGAMLPTIWRLVYSKLVHTVTFVGAAASGKTVAAVALLRKLLDAAAWDSVRDMPGPQASAIVQRAAGARFVAAYDITPPPDADVRGRMSDAMRAGFLVFDDVGEEIAADDTRQSAERAQRTGQVIKHAYRGGRTLIVTTAYPDDRAFAAVYGDGIARRLWGWRIDDGIAVVDCDECKVYRG